MLALQGGPADILHGEKKGARTLAKNIEPETRAIIAAWNACGGEFVLSDADVLCEMVGVEDPELLIFGIMVIRDYFRREADATTRH